MPHPGSSRVGTSLPALSPAPLSGEVRHNSPHESLQGLGVQEPEHEMRHPHCMKALQFMDHFCAASGHEVLALCTILPEYRTTIWLCETPGRGDGDVLPAKVATIENRSRSSMPNPIVSVYLYLKQSTDDNVGERDFGEQCKTLYRSF